LPVWMRSSMLQRRPATLTRTVSGAGRGHPAAVEGQLLGLAVAADKEPMLPAPVGAAGVQADERPVVVAVALGAPAGRDALPGPSWDTPQQRVGAASLPATGTRWSRRPPGHSRPRGPRARPAALGRRRRPHRRSPTRLGPWRPAPAQASVWPGPAWSQTRPGRGRRPPAGARGYRSTSGAGTAPGRPPHAQHRWRRPGRRPAGQTRSRCDAGSAVGACRTVGLPARLMTQAALHACRESA
jgi:hypothetical protein